MSSRFMAPEAQLSVFQSKRRRKVPVLGSHPGDASLKATQPVPYRQPRHSARQSAVLVEDLLSHNSLVAGRRRQESRVANLLVERDGLPLLFAGLL